MAGEKPIYLDCNATTPMEPAVLDAMLPYFRDEIGNAGSRTHVHGAKAKQSVESARRQVADVLSARPDEVIFTSGATESNNLAILGLAQHGLATNRRHIVSTQIEHKAVLEPLEALAARGFDVTLVPPNPGGWVESEAIGEALRDDTLLVSVMHANNETGIRQPIPEISAILAEHPAYFHVDAAQTFGKIIDELQNPRIDIASISAHKIYGPKGVGALLTRRRKYSRPPLSPLSFGGGQERGLRPGTLPVPLIVGFGETANLALRDHRKREAENLAFRKCVIDALTRLSPQYTGDQGRCMAHVLNLSFPGVDSEALMLRLKEVVALSNGSACTSARHEPSHVLQAMGMPEEVRRGSIRISWCHMTPRPDFAEVVSRVRSLL